MTDSKTRKGPNENANNLPLGTRQRGIDGNIWKIVKMKNGVKRWQKDAWKKGLFSLIKAKFNINKTQKKNNNDKKKSIKKNNKYKHFKNLKSLKNVKTLNPYTNKFNQNLYYKKHFEDQEKKIWGKLGKVWSPKRERYVTLGTDKSYKVIKYELKRNEIWYKYVKLMAKKDSNWGDKMKSLLLF